MKVAINGLGRIGRMILKLCLENGIDVGAVNDIHDIENVVYLLKYDSVYGPYKEKVDCDRNHLIINGKKIPYLVESDPRKLLWKAHKIDVVIEATGKFTERKDAEMHIHSGAKKVVITAPAENPDITVVPGVNDLKLNKSHNIISVASCTTNCLTPITHVLQKEYGIEKGFLTTAHAYTNDQEIQDSFNKKMRRGRAGAENIVPTSSGATEATCQVMPELGGKVKGLALRVPVICGSIVDFVAELKKDFTVEDINKSLKKAAEGELKGILAYSEDELVSSDIIGNSNSSIIDGLSTQKIGNMVKILAWYDNEYGYSNRVIDVLKILKKQMRWSF